MSSSRDPTATSLVKDIEKHKDQIAKFTSSTSFSIATGIESSPMTTQLARATMAPPNSPAHSTRSKDKTVSNPPQAMTEKPGTSQKNLKLDLQPTSAIMCKENHSLPNMSNLGSKSPSIIKTGPNLSNEAVPQIAPSKTQTSQSNLDVCGVRDLNDDLLINKLLEKFPNLENEIRYLGNCPEKIGLEPLRDIMISKIRSTKHANVAIQALVTGIRAGLSYSLREQHQNYLDMFKDMKSIMEESAKTIRDTSKSLEQTLHTENKESGKTISALKEVLGGAHDLAKTLTEGKTHGHLLNPSDPPEYNLEEVKDPSHIIESPKSSDPDIGLLEMINHTIEEMNSDKFEATSRKEGKYYRIYTQVGAVDYVLTWNPSRMRWGIKLVNKEESTLPEAKPYLQLFADTVTFKKLFNRPKMLSMGWFIYQVLPRLAPSEDPDKIWKENAFHILNMIPL